MARSKGTGTLIKRGRYWQCKIIIDGKPHYKATGTASKVEAKKMLEDFVRPFLAGSEVERLEAVETRLRIKEAEAADAADDLSNVRLNLVVDKYYSMANAKAISEHTMANYDKFLSKMLGWAKTESPDATKVKDVDKVFAERYLEWLKPKVSAGYYNCSLALFRKIWKEFGRLSKHRCFAENPWDGYRYKGADLSVKRPLTAEEVQRVFAAAEDPDTRLLFAIGLYTGLRLGDCSELKWKDVDMDRRVIRVTPIKTKRYGRSVAIPIHPTLYRELDAKRRTTLPGPEDAYVSPENARRYKANENKRISKVLKAADIKTVDKGRSVVSFHSLRHTFCSMAVSAGIPMDVIRQIVGHSTTKMTEHYSHSSMEDFSKAVNAIPGIGDKAAKKSLVEIDTKIIMELNAMGTTVEEALREYVGMKANTVNVETAA